MHCASMQKGRQTQYQLPSRSTLDGSKKIQQYYNQWKLDKNYLLNTKQHPNGNKNKVIARLKHRRSEKINFSVTR